MSQPTTIRCSQLDSLWACAPSVLAEGPDLVRVGSSHPAAELGKAVHEMAAMHVDGHVVDIARICEAHGLDEDQRDDAEELMEYVEKSWGRLGTHFPTPMTEKVVCSDEIGVAGQEYIVRGTCDLLSPRGATHAIFMDWKTGLIDDKYRHQMNGYAYAIWVALGRPADTSITGVVVFLRHRYYRVIKWDARQLEEWEYDLAHNVLARTEQYKVGSQCTYCELYGCCPARKAMVGGVLDVMMNHAGQKPPPDVDLAGVSAVLNGLDAKSKDDPAVGRLLRNLMTRTKLAEQAIKDCKDMIRAAVERVGPIPLDEETALAIREITIKNVDPVRAMAALRRVLSDQQIAAAMKLSLPKLAKQYAGQHMIERRTKVVQRRELEDILADARAIKPTTQRRLEKVRLADLENQPQQEQSDGTSQSGHSHAQSADT